MKNTASEKIARVFEIAGYLWLTPSIISLFYPFIFLLGCIFTAKATAALALAVPFLIFGAGVFLLVQYYRHSRGRLGEGKINALWVGTLVFNLLFLLPSVYGFYSISKTAVHHPPGGHDARNFFIIVIGVLILWWSAAVLMSVTALMSRFRHQKYL